MKDKEIKRVTKEHVKKLLSRPTDKNDPMYIYAKILLEGGKPNLEQKEAFNKQVDKIFEPLKKTIKKIHENNDEGKKFRGEIITDIIDLDEYLEEIILKRYIKEEYKKEFEDNLLNDESFSSALKKKIVFRSGFLENYKGLKKDIEYLYLVRNIVAHRKYSPTTETIMVLNKKGGMEDIKSLKKAFDETYTKTIEILKEVIKKVNYLSDT